MRLVSAALHTVARVAFLWVPILVVFMGTGFVLEVAHAPVAYSDHYLPPAQYGKAYTESPFSASPTASGGWKIFGLDGAGNVSMRVVGSGAQVASDNVVDRNGNALSAPSMAWSGLTSVGAWVAQASSVNQTLKMAYFTAHKTVVTTLVKTGSQQTPFVVRNPAGGYDVLFAWQRPGQNSSLYGAVVRANGTVAHRKLLLRAPSYDFSPRAVWDGDHHLDVLYMQACCQGSEWNIVFQRFDRALRPIGPGAKVGRLGSLGTSTPTQWGMDLQRDRHGNVWGAWAEDSGVDVARWNRNGKNSFVRFLGSASLDFTASAVSLVLQQADGLAFYTSTDTLGAHLVATSFDNRGRPLSTDRVAYDGGGDAAYPEAALVAGVPRVVWQKFGRGSTTIEGSEYRRSIVPTLAERLGLGVGNSIANLAFLSVGSLAVAVPLTAVNILILAPLLLLWIPVARFVPERFKWPSYVGIVAAVLILIFGVRSFANGWAFVLGPLGAPLSWLAVGSAVFVGVWISRVGMSTREPAFRATVLVLSAFYFVAAMWALTGIESQLSVI